LIKLNLKGTTIRRSGVGLYRSAGNLLKPASEGTGVHSPAVRFAKVMQVAGIHKLLDEVGLVFRIRTTNVVGESDVAALLSLRMRRTLAKSVQDGGMK